MKKMLTLLLALTALTGQAQQPNPLMSADFWKSNPDLNTVKAEIAKGHSPSQPNAASFDPVTMAINNRASNEVIKFMIEQEGNGITKKTHHSRSYLHWAAASGNLELVNYLIAKGSDVHYADSHGYPITAYAASTGNKNTQVYDALFKAGVDPKQRYADGATLLHLAIASDEELKLTDYFISKGLSLSETDEFGRTAADYAARAGKPELLEKIIKKGIQPTDQALFFAAQGSRMATASLDTYKYLVEKLKLSPTAVSKKDGSTILHSLVRRPNAEILDYFLSKGVDVNKKDHEGNTALMLASGGRDVKVVEILLDKSKDINALNDKGESALTKAVASGSAEVVNLLIGKGADVNVINKDGHNLAYYWFDSFREAPQMGGREPGPQSAGRGPTAPERMGRPQVEGERPAGAQAGRGQGGPERSRAQGGGERPAGAPQGGFPVNNDFDEKMTLLSQAGLNIVAPQKDGTTLFHIAVAKESLPLIRKAAQLGANINAQDKEGITPLHKAALIAKDDKILKLLVALGAKKDLKTEFDETAYDLAKENNFLAGGNVSLDFLK